MKFQTLHTHTTFCDGQATPAQMAQAAFDAGCSAIGFSGHSPLAGEDWTMKAEDVPAYRSEVLAQRRRWQGLMDVYLGLEQDFFSPPPQGQWDYLIGSVHGVLADGVVRWVDESEETFRALLDQMGGAVPLARAYYEMVAQVPARTGCQIVGHLDLLTKYNEADRLFDTSCRAYRHAALEALEAVLEQDALVEVNTGAMARGSRTEPYPAAFLLRQIAQKGGRVLLTADSHSPDTVVFGYARALEWLQACGISSLWVLTPDGFREQGIEIAKN